MKISKKTKEKEKTLREMRRIIKKCKKTSYTVQHSQNLTVFMLPLELEQGSISPL